MKSHFDLGVTLADALPRDQAHLIVGRFAEGLTYRDLARRHRTNARLIRRRVERIAARMQSPEFRFTLLHEKQLPARMRKTARLLFLHGQSLRETAEVTGHTLHRIRTDRATLSTLARAAG
jgi:DNA-directed RNA polymerase specialized sigma24 family protein